MTNPYVHMAAMRYAKRSLVKWVLYRIPVLIMLGIIIGKLSAM